MSPSSIPPSGRPSPRVFRAPLGVASLSRVGVPSAPGGAANDADFLSRQPDQVELRFRDLRIAPSLPCLALMGCVVPVLALAVALESWLALAGGIGLLMILLGCVGVGIESLRGLRLSCTPPLPGFAGDTVMLALSVSDRSGRARRDIAVTVGDLPVPSAAGWIDVAPRATVPVLIPMPAVGRGRRPVPPVRLETRHPFGLARVSATWAPRREWRVSGRPAPF
ncbi:hypothetical protein [Mitsuaria sp. GD03876]|uniref:hypothetical protein n=1 Tax=Mitsuaria sp. GD03876 TaxID=2975399 RepID=UPI00244BB389|nr:hypothetical protein [Mitsuaria sp. GD03876]MDH0867600.1 hypothetical protein [Mitsuaria sp. GD03876]